MKIDIICLDGSPLGVVPADIHGDNGRIGIGGAELALLTLCEAWAARGDEVRLYNNPVGPVEKFPQLPIERFDKLENRDVLIVFRTPNYLADGATGKKVWFSTDQYTSVDFAPFAPTVDKIVVISPFHQRYFEGRYGITGTTVIDLPVRTWEYEQPIERIPNKVIFCSVPDRGLAQMGEIWARVYEQMPEASLVVTSDYRLWGVREARNEQYLMRFAMKNARMVGAVPRRELVEHQLSSDLMVYPCTYDELFCISVAECSVAGAYPMTSYNGALETTNEGYIQYGNPLDGEWQRAMADRVVSMLNNRKLLEKERKRLQAKAKKRFDIDNILKQWDKRIFK